jgi:hypothetical protein
LGARGVVFLPPRFIAGAGKAKFARENARAPEMPSHGAKKDKYPFRHFALSFCARAHARRSAQKTCPFFSLALMEESGSTTTTRYKQEEEKEPTEEDMIGQLLGRLRQGLKDTSGWSNELGQQVCHHPSLKSKKEQGLVHLMVTMRRFYHGDADMCVFMASMADPVSDSDFVRIPSNYFLAIELFKLRDSLDRSCVQDEVIAFDKLGCPLPHLIKAPPSNKNNNNNNASAWRPPVWIFKTTADDKEWVYAWKPFFFFFVSSIHQDLMIYGLVETPPEQRDLIAVKRLQERGIRVVVRPPWFPPSACP